MWTFPNVTVFFLFSYFKVFEIDDVKAWKSVLISATSYALGLFMISKAPWYLLPLAWAWTGTAVTGVCSKHLSLSYIGSCNFLHSLFFFPVTMIYLSQLIPFSFCLSNCEVFCYRSWLCAQIILKKQITGRHRWNAGLSAVDIPIWTMAV